MMKANIHAASKATLSGQLRFLGLFASSYFLSREIVVPTKGTGVADFFHLPNNCVIELGTRVQI